jgi:hypothetical protein
MQIPFKKLMILPISTFSKNENEPNLNPIFTVSSFNLASPMGPASRWFLNSCQLDKHD